MLLLDTNAIAPDEGQAKIFHRVYTNIKIKDVYPVHIALHGDQTICQYSETFGKLQWDWASQT